MVLFAIDIDGTIADVGDRFLSHPAPPERSRDNEEYKKWLDKVQDPNLMYKDCPVAGTQQMVQNLDNACFVTSRGEKYREITEKWLTKNNFPHVALFMRPEGNEEPSGILKESLIKQAMNSFNCNTAVVFDDDPKGDIEEMCHRNKWTFFKSTSGGKVPA